jgi:hypothetical protein
MQLFNEINWFIQRGIRGYADCDLWDFDFYLSNLKANALVQFKNSLYSYPGNITEEEWDNILDKIIFTFETEAKVSSADWLYLSEKDKIKYTFNEDYSNVIHIMTKEECEKLREGWNLYRKYFHSLWN